MAESAIPVDGVELYYPGPGHTRDNLVVWLPETRMLFAGCLVKSGLARSLGFVAEADLAAWPSALDRLGERYRQVEVVVPGHGPRGGSWLLGHTLKLVERETGSVHDSPVGTP